MRHVSNKRRQPNHQSQFPKTQDARKRLRIILYCWCALLIIVFWFAGYSGIRFLVDTSFDRVALITSYILFLVILYAVFVGLIELIWWALRKLYGKYAPIPSFDAKSHHQHKESARKEIRLFVIISVILSLLNIWTLDKGMGFWWNSAFLLVGLISMVLMWLHQRIGLHIYILSSVATMGVPFLVMLSPDGFFIGSTTVLVLYLLWLSIMTVLFIGYVWNRRAAFE